MIAAPTARTQHRLWGTASEQSRCRRCPRQQRRRTVMASKLASNKVHTPTSPPSGCKVVGMGSCGMDYLAQVAEFPSPDDKLRTERLELRGGGNCANALTAAARLGVSPTLISKIGGDALGAQILADLEGDGVCTDFVVRAEGHPSPFTYIIVDRAGGTRTCIHTPGAPFNPSELTPELSQSILQDAQLVYFDGRLAEAAVLLARAARAAGIPVLVEGERLRPNLDALLAEADYVVTSEHFPQDWTGAPTLGDAMVSLMTRLPQARFVITTRGKRGAVMLLRTDSQTSATEEASPQQVIDVLASQLEAQANNEGAEQDVACTGTGGVQVTMFHIVKGRIHPGNNMTTGLMACRAGGVVDSQRSYLLRPQQDASSTLAAAEAAQRAAVKAAAANADAVNAAHYRMGNTGNNGASPDLARTQGDAFVGRVLVSSAASLPPEAVADTTGAGDAFIGSVLYSLCAGLSHAQMLQLAAVVAACKCTALGARPGLPSRDSISSELLTAMENCKVTTTC